MVFDLPLHPMVIHFPIALLIIGFASDLSGLVLRSEWLKRAGLMLLILGAVAAAAAVKTGSMQEETILKPATMEATIETHEESGETTMWFFLVLAAARAAAAGFKKLSTAPHVVLILAWAVGLALLTRTAYYGGELVYRHGAGVGVGASAGTIPGGAPPADRD